jgi:hypothetical protein
MCVVRLAHSITLAQQIGTRCLQVGRVEKLRFTMLKKLYILQKRNSIIQTTGRKGFESNIGTMNGRAFERPHQRKFIVLFDLEQEYGGFVENLHVETIIKSSKLKNRSCNWIN